MSDFSGVKFMTVEEVASLMRVSKMTVYRLLKTGELTSVRVGRSFRIPEKRGARVHPGSPGSGAVGGVR